MRIFFELEIDSDLPVEMQLELLRAFVLHYGTPRVHGLVDPRFDDIEIDVAKMHIRENYTIPEDIMEKFKIYMRGEMNETAKSFYKSITGEDPPADSSFLH